MYNLVYMAKPIYGGWVSYTAHISLKYDYPIHKIGKRTEKNMRDFGYLVILGVLGTSIAIILFNTLIKKSSAVFASTTTYLIPIFAIMWGVIDGETIYQNDFLGIIIVLIGVFIMNVENSGIKKYCKSI